MGANDVPPGQVKPSARLALNKAKCSISRELRQPSAPTVHVPALTGGEGEGGGSGEGEGGGGGRGDGGGGGKVKASDTHEAPVVCGQFPKQFASSSVEPSSEEAVQRFAAEAPGATLAPLRPAPRGALSRTQPQGVTFLPNEEHQGGFVALLRKGERRQGRGGRGGGDSSRRRGGSRSTRGQEVSCGS